MYDIMKNDRILRSWTSVTGYQCSLLLNISSIYLYYLFALVAAWGVYDFFNLFVCQVAHELRTSVISPCKTTPIGLQAVCYSSLITEFRSLRERRRNSNQPFLEYWTDIIRKITSFYFRFPGRTKHNESEIEMFPKPLNKRTRLRP